jgi:DNA-binding GntR family transcriptional regulator
MGAGRSDGRERNPDLAAIVTPERDATGTAQGAILASLRSAILSGALEPGVRLRQVELAQLFGTSRIPVREALRDLEYEGLVASEPHRGFTVAALDADDVEEIYQLRIVLEGHAVRLALPVLADDDLEDLERLFEAMEHATAARDRALAWERFSLRLYSVGGHRRLVELITKLRQDVTRVIQWSSIQHSHAVHEQFFEAVRVGDADRAAAVLTNHYQRVIALIRRSIREAHLAQTSHGLLSSGILLPDVEEAQKRPRTLSTSGGTSRRSRRPS